MVHCVNRPNIVERRAVSPRILSVLLGMMCTPRLVVSSNLRSITRS